jgi:hypothetical protein
MPSLQFPDVLFWLVLAGMVGYFLFNTVRRGSFRTAMFNAHITGTLGEVEASGPKLVSQRLKVHVLERDGRPLVGVEVTSKSVGSWEMLPVVLSPSQARELSALLKLASEGK